MAIPASASNRFYLQTFGCQMNARDSAWLSDALQDRGFILTSPEDADYIILNTCSVREKPENKVIQAIRRYRHLTNGKARFVVLGCVAQQLGAALLEGNADVMLVAGGEHIQDVPEFLTGQNAASALLDFRQEYPERPYGFERMHGPAAYVNIMSGCDNFCAYCIVPYTRGRQKSRQPQAIYDECAFRLGQGAGEIVLLGQNVNAWGKDLRGACGFSALLHRIASLPGLRRLRFITPHPRDFDQETVEVFADLPVVASWLHLPLQSGSDRILAKMGRGYTARQYLDLADKLKKARPDLALATDIIVGFPGETEADFQETLAVMRECAYASSFSFCYSDRPGTKAERMAGKIGQDIKLERLGRLQELQESLTATHLQGKVGQKALVLLEKRSARGGLAFWSGKDGNGDSVNIDFGDDANHEGEFITVSITCAKKHSLLAVPC